MFFPMFIDLTGKQVTIIGGGRVAARRARALLAFGCRVRVIAPEFEPIPGVEWLSRPYRPGDLAGSTLAVAATNLREINRAVGEEARAAGIPVSVADCPEECTFYFPAVCHGADVVAGVCSSGVSPGKTACAAAAIRETLASLEELTELDDLGEGAWL